MRLAIYTDNHWCQYSSIVRSRGVKYSTRLENQIASLNWVEEEALNKGCDAVVCLGDFFDKETLNSEELSALSELNFGKVPHWYIVGNHEAGVESLSFSSAHTMRLSNSMVYQSPESVICGDTEICILPYYTEDRRKSLIEIFGNKKCKNRIILSHNDISGIQYGQYVSSVGYPLDEIEECCDMFINGHLHNGERITDKVINLGNLTGQNFSEDAISHNHCIMILDTDTLAYDLVENPNALNFYKLTFDELNRVKLKNNSVLTVQVDDDGYQRETAEKFIESSQSVIAHRIVIKPALSRNGSVIDKCEELSTVDHIQSFKEFIKASLGESDVIISELNEISK